MIFMDNESNGFNDMKLSSKCEYACLAIIDLSENYDKGLNRIHEIAERKNIPKKFLEQILLVLKQSGYVKSKKGSEGGYRLAKPPKDITLAEIIRLMDGALAPVESVSTYFYESTPIEQCKPLLHVFKEIRDYVAQRMESTSFLDLIKK
jgi:Rrf2 family cysteine metabolism transcriptional repressor